MVELARLSLDDERDSPLVERRQQLLLPRLERLRAPRRFESGRLGLASLARVLLVVRRRRLAVAAVPAAATTIAADVSVSASQPAAALVTERLPRQWQRRHRRQHAQRRARIAIRANRSVQHTHQRRTAIAVAVVAVAVAAVGVVGVAAVGTLPLLPPPPLVLLLSSRRQDVADLLPQLRQRQRPPRRRQGEEPLQLRLAWVRVGPDPLRKRAARRRAAGLRLAALVAGRRKRRAVGGRGALLCEVRGDAVLDDAAHAAQHHHRPPRRAARVTHEARRAARRRTRVLEGDQHVGQRVRLGGGRPERDGVERPVVARAGQDVLRRQLREDADERVAGGGGVRLDKVDRLHVGCVPLP